MTIGTVFTPPAYDMTLIIRETQSSDQKERSTREGLLRERYHPGYLSGGGRLRYRRQLVIKSVWEGKDYRQPGLPENLRSLASMIRFAFPCSPSFSSSLTPHHHNIIPTFLQTSFLYSKLENSTANILVFPTPYHPLPSYT